MAVPHIPLNLLLWYKRRYRVDHDDVHRSGAYHRLCDLQCLVSAVRLRNIKLIDIHTNIARVNRIQCMFRINKSGDAASLLNLCDHVQRHRRLTAGLRPVDLHNPSLRHASKSQCDIQAQCSCRHRLHCNLRLRIAKTHHGPFSKILL